MVATIQHDRSPMNVPLMCTCSYGRHSFVNRPCWSPFQLTEIEQKKYYQFGFWTLRGIRTYPGSYIVGEGHTQWELNPRLIGESVWTILRGLVARTYPFT